MNTYTVKLRKRLLRINKLKLLCVAYTNYTQRNLYSACTRHKIDYEEAEKFSNLMNVIFRQDTTTNDFLMDIDELIDESLLFHQKYKDCLSEISEIGFLYDLDVETVESFCKKLEYGHWCLAFKSIFHMQAEKLLNACNAYILGVIDDDMFRNYFRWIGPSLKPEPANLKSFLRIMNDVENQYDEVNKKRKARLNKKILSLQNKN